LSKAFDDKKKTDTENVPPVETPKQGKKRQRKSSAATASAAAPRRKKVSDDELDYEDVEYSDDDDDMYYKDDHSHRNNQNGNASNNNNNNNNSNNHNNTFFKEENQLKKQRTSDSQFHSTSENSGYNQPPFFAVPTAIPNSPFVFPAQTPPPPLFQHREPEINARIYYDTEVTRKSHEDTREKYIINLEEMLDQQNKVLMQKNHLINIKDQTIEQLQRHIETLTNSNGWSQLPPKLTTIPYATSSSMPPPMSSSSQNQPKIEVPLHLQSHLQSLHMKQQPQLQSHSHPQYATTPTPSSPQYTPIQGVIHKSPTQQLHSPTRSPIQASDQASSIHQYPHHLSPSYMHQHAKTSQSENPSQHITKQSYHSSHSSSPSSQGDTYPYPHVHEAQLYPEPSQSQPSTPSTHIFAQQPPEPLSQSLPDPGPEQIQSKNEEAGQCCMQSLVPDAPNENDNAHVAELHKNQPQAEVL
jgi:hypothetical protein